MPGDQTHRLGAQAHGAAHVLDALLLGQQVDHRERRLLVELPGVGARHAADGARELDDGALHAQADAQVGHVVLATVLDGLDLALDAAHAEAAGHDHAVGGAEAFGHGRRRELLGVDPQDAQLAAVVDGRVLEGLPDRQVGLVELHVLADQRDGDRLVTGVDALDQRAPLGRGRARRGEAELAHHELVEPLFVHVQRHLVDVVDVARRHDGLGLDVAEEGDLVADAAAERLFGARHDDVGLDADLAQLGDAVLRGLGLELADHADDRHQRDVDVQHVVAPDVLAELADGLEEGQALDVADRAADLGDEHVDVELLGQPVDAALDLVRDVRDDLHGAAQEVAPALLLDHGVVDAAGGDVGVALDELVDEALVVAQVEIGLGAVFGDEHLAVLEGAHRAGVDVDVGVELLVGDLQAAGLEQPPDRRGGDALAEAGHHAPGHEDVLRHAPSLVTSGHVVVAGSRAGTPMVPDGGDAVWPRPPPPRSPARRERSRALGPTQRPCKARRASGE